MVIENVYIVSEIVFKTLKDAQVKIIFEGKEMTISKYFERMFNASLHFPSYTQQCAQWRFEYKAKNTRLEIADIFCLKVGENHFYFEDTGMNSRMVYTYNEEECKEFRDNFWNESMIRHFQKQGEVHAW